MNARLSLLMFLLYAVMGAWVPLFTLLLRQRGLSADETGWCCATSALGALLAPFVWGQIADRWLAAQKCISLCALLCGLALLALAELGAAWAIFLVSLIHWFFMYPASNLTTALTFRHLEDPQKEFGAVRLWGTVGWVAAGWLVGFWLRAHYWFAETPMADDAEPDWSPSLRLGAGVAFLLALYALTLPDTPPSPSRASAEAGPLRRLFEAPLLALRLLRQPSLALLCFCLFGLYITIPFYSQLTPLLLHHLGVPDRWLPVTLTLAQSLEIVTLGMLPILLLRLEEKGTLFTGMSAWSFGMLAWSFAAPLWLVVAALGANGIFICCFIVTAQMVINRRCPHDIRASAQGMIQFINGLGLLIGHVLVGRLRYLFNEDFTPIFSVAAILAGMLTVLFVAFFRTPAGSAPAAPPQSRL